MASIRQTKLQKSLRNRECWNCGNKINKSEYYVLRQVRYDKTIISFYYHKECALSNAIQID